MIDTTLSHYRIIAQLGMGLVHESEEKSLDRIAAFVAYRI